MTELRLKVKDYLAFFNIFSAFWQPSSYQCSHMTYQESIKTLLKCSFRIKSLFFSAVTK